MKEQIFCSSIKHSLRVQTGAILGLLIKEYAISLTSEEGYTKPFPLLLNTTMKIREFISIDENENSISIRVNMVSTWKDSGLNCSNKIDP